MLLRALKLLNFRQFLGEQIIQFATDEYKNVTVIMGENGSGKTTLAQAFTWCLYGDTEFEDKSIINRAVESKILPGGESSVRVDLDLTHNGSDYTIVREQLYKRDSTGKLKAQNTTLNIAYKRNGQQEFVNHSEVNSVIKQILPKELSRYFFFDGERIGSMSKEIKKGRSQDFAQAVRGLLGLNAFIAAIEHLKPTSKYGVIGSYNESYDSASDKRISQYTDEILKEQEIIDKIESRLFEITSEMEIAQDKCDVLRIKLSESADTEKLQLEKNRNQDRLEKTKQSRMSAITAMLKQFNNNASTYFGKSLILNSLEHLSKAEKLDKGIPDMHARTIEFLIQRGFCVCGSEIKFGNGAYQELNKALEFLPPQSIGMSINQFVKESEIRTKSSNELFETISDNYSSVREYETQIEQLESDIQSIEKEISTKPKIGNLQQDLWRYEKIIRDRITERDELNQRKGAAESKRDRKNTEREELTLRDENNKKIEIYKKYAQHMFDELSRVYKINEDKTRMKLERNVNEIFKKIYEGGMSLTIDEGYNIHVIIEDEGGISSDVETSTAQSISVILAFIAGIIKIARESSIEQDTETRMLESEPYPLVMDAPLSAFDRRRIKTVCDVLPNIAEQVIIFIKDTDGELAEKNMGTKVGRRYKFDKKSEFETHLLSR